eukprot:tig00000169_g11883.t1
MGRSVRRPKKRGSAKVRRVQKVKKTTPTLHQTLDVWEDKATLKANYKKLGLATNPNKSHTTGHAPRGSAGSGVVVALRKLDSGEEVAYEPPSEDEEEDSEGEDAEAMSEDDEEGEVMKPVDALEAALAAEAPLLEPKIKPRLSEAERKTTEALFRKHGDNFEAQARDIKLNAHQLTAAALRKRHAEYVKYYGAEKLVPPAPRAPAAPAPAPRAAAKEKPAGKAEKPAAAKGEEKKAKEAAAAAVAEKKKAVVPEKKAGKPASAAGKGKGKGSA